MRRYLLVLGMGLLTLNEELDLEPVNYLVGRQEQERGEVVVLAVVANRPVKLSPLELLLGAATAHGQSAPAKYPAAPQPGHHVNATAEHRMNLAVRQLKTIGYQARGLMSDQELVKAVGAETRRHHYDEVIVATGRQGGQLAGAQPASGPGSSAAAQGATAGHTSARPGCEAESITAEAATRYRE